MGKTCHIFDPVGPDYLLENHKTHENIKISHNALIIIFILKMHFEYYF